MDRRKLLQSLAAIVPIKVLLGAEKIEAEAIGLTPGKKYVVVLSTRVSSAQFDKFVFYFRKSLASDHPLNDAPVVMADGDEFKIYELDAEK